MTPGSNKAVRSNHLPRPPAPDPLRDALFLDFDGTLVEIAARPDAIRPRAGLGRLIARIAAAFQGCLVIVSGRMVADVDRYLGLSDLSVAGVHGAEIRGVPEPDAAVQARVALARLRAEIARRAAGLLVEDKGVALALHYRDAPERAPHAQDLASDIAARSGGTLAVQPGRMVFELKPAGLDKGTVVQSFLQAPRFAGRRPIFVGDDLTDEDGFRAASARGGYGVLVSGGPERPSAARFGLPDVAAVLSWLGDAERETGP